MTEVVFFAALPDSSFLVSDPVIVERVAVISPDSDTEFNTVLSAL